MNGIESAVWAALAEVPDPEIPQISVVDLGVVRSVEADQHSIRVEMLPTFAGCPAVEQMRAAVVQRLAGMAPEVRVDMTFREPWTSDRISQSGRRNLAGAGFAPPAAAQGSADAGPITLAPVAECPFCGSRRTVMENAFGPTLCRAIYYCTACRQPFEQFKTV